MNNLKSLSPKILVVGDLMIDHYIRGECERISPEAPVQVIKVNLESSSLGGAGNVVNNLKDLGAEVEVISVIGECEISLKLKNLLKNINIKTSNLITEKGRIASKKNRIISSNQQVVRFDQESTNDISISSQESIIRIYKKIINQFEIVIFSDYGKGLFTPKLTQSLIKTANKNNIRVLIDPKGSDYSKYNGAFLLTPNKKEASEATNIKIFDDATLLDAIKSLKLNYSLNVSLITLSELGIGVYDDNFRLHPTASIEIFDVTGAGDTVIASLGFALACGMKMDPAIEFSNLAAGVVIGKLGSATATINEIINYESRTKTTSSAKNIKSFDEIIELSSHFRENKKKIIFTNGCFDILHSGHVRYLEEAKNHGDILIVGLNSDKSTKILKGDNRPINNEDDRAYILSAINAVDYVVIFDEETPFNLIKAINPDILIKGSDYNGKTISGEDIVKEVKLVDFIKGKSTTNIINKIQKKCR